MPSYLFLDFDGCLHPGLAGTFVYLPLLQEFLLEQPDVHVVLSTSWRLDTPLSELLRLFHPAVRSRIVGATPALPDQPGQRWAEIQLWLQKNNATHCAWVALDDDKSLFPAYCDNVVWCDPARGLRKYHLPELARKLGIAQSS